MLSALVLVPLLVVAAPSKAPTAAPGQCPLAGPPGGRRPSVDELIAEGIRLREATRDTEALDCFRLAWDDAQGGRAMAQMALAEQALGRWVDAETHLKAALDAKQDSWINANRQALDGALKTIQGRLASLDVLTDIVGAEVVLNGRVIGRTPLAQAARVAAGNVDIEVTADGYRTGKRSILISAGKIMRESFEMRPMGTSEPPPSSPPPPTQSDGRVTTQAPSSSISPWVWITGGVGLGGVAIGIVGLVISAADINEFNASPCGMNMTNSPECNSQRDSAGQSGKAVAAVGFVTGGVLIATSVVLFFVLDDSKEAMAEAASMPVGVWVSENDSGLFLRGSF